MDLDDPFAEPVVAKAPTVGRFQPKSKPRPKKGPSIAAKSTTKDVIANESVLLNDLAEKKSYDPKSLSVVEAESLVIPHEEGNVSTEIKEVSGSAVIKQSKVALSNPIVGKDLGVDLSLKSQLPPDGISLSTTAAYLPSDTSGIQIEHEEPVDSNIIVANASPLSPCDSHSVSDQSKIVQEPECYKESNVCGDGDLHLNVDQLDIGDLSCLDILDIAHEDAFASEKSAVKFQPKPEPQSDKQKHPAVAASQLPHDLEPLSEHEHKQSNGSMHALEHNAIEHNTISDVLHMRDEELSFDCSENRPDTLVSKDTDPSFLEKPLQQASGENFEETNSHQAFDSCAKSVDVEVVSGFEGNENGYDILAGVNNELHDNGSSYDRITDELASNREEYNGGEHLAEETLQKKKPRKSKKVASQNDKPIRKRKKKAQESVEATEKPPKKFPRATQRKRSVNKSLLETPEDELDLQRVPIKDLIILAEYREREAKKEAAAAVQPSTNERTDSILSEDPPYDDNEALGFDQDGDGLDNPSTSGIMKDTGYFNYQSFMTKEPRAKWSKHDTELFYKGIRQFGSDLSMIQRLFPGRTRHQIKLKYKKEERQNPMRLDDALASRLTDFSHFELVIKSLQEQAAQEAKSDREDSVCPTGNDEEQPEEGLNIDEDVAKVEQNKEDKVDDQESDKHYVKSPPKSYYSEEDFDLYNPL
ncbi:uncharacterized protein LOC130806176 isoform X2 [Amaranthus tricolor]|uniref:uncharacterized protein LOC130806176 isoform X2 n=1 Tax=Amaranthus tricolor TaxID=29722 RepID=UPI00258C20DF|nr:uncharacterized protein LOC130806176 isoform X2 [Amaranthus tricolor]